VEYGYILHLLRDHPKPTPKKQLKQIGDLSQKQEKIKTFYLEVRTKPNKYVRKEVFH